MFRTLMVTFVAPPFSLRAISRSSCSKLTSHLQATSDTTIQYLEAARVDRITPASVITTPWDACMGDTGVCISVSAISY